jgi:hypothetical protein
LLNSGTLSPNPWDLTLSGQNVWSKLEDTRTEDKAPQGCDLSAASSAGMAGAASMSEPSRIQTPTPSALSLLQAKNGLDRGVHFSPSNLQPITAQKCGPRVLKAGLGEG